MAKQGENKKTSHLTSFRRRMGLFTALWGLDRSGLSDYISLMISSLHGRESLLNQLNSYTAADEEEQNSLTKMQAFLASEKACFQRSTQKGHFTGSAWLINASSDKVLLTLHKKLNRWLQLGGHADGETDLAQVALREAQEESGLQKIRLLSSHILDVSVHSIPTHVATGVPAHEHYDVRYLVQAHDDIYSVSHESHALAWFTWQDLQRMELPNNMMRMARKWQNLTRSSAHDT